MRHESADLTDFFSARSLGYTPENHTHLYVFRDGTDPRAGYVFGFRGTTFADSPPTSWTRAEFRMEPEEEEVAIVLAGSNVPGYTLILDAGDDEVQANWTLGPHPGYRYLAPTAKTMAIYDGTPARLARG